MSKAESAGSGGSKGRALVVEDEPHIRELVSLHLGLEGLTVTPAVDGEEALRQASDEPFDIIVLDLMLPKIDGVTVCRAVRRQGSASTAKILGCSAAPPRTYSAVCPPFPTWSSTRIQPERG